MKWVLAALFFVLATARARLDFYSGRRFQPRDLSVQVEYLVQSPYDWDNFYDEEEDDGSVEIYAFAYGSGYGYEYGCGYGAGYGYGYGAGYGYGYDGCGCGNWSPGYGYGYGYASGCTDGGDDDDVDPNPGDDDDGDCPDDSGNSGSGPTSGATSGGTGGSSPSSSSSGTGSWNGGTGASMDPSSGGTGSADASGGSAGTSGGSAGASGGSAGASGGSVGASTGTAGASGGWSGASGGSTGSAGASGGNPGGRTGVAAGCNSFTVTPAALVNRPIDPYYKQLGAPVQGSNAAQACGCLGETLFNIPSAYVATFFQPTDKTLWIKSYKGKTFGFQCLAINSPSILQRPCSSTALVACSHDTVHSSSGRVFWPRLPKVGSGWTALQAQDLCTTLGQALPGQRVAVLAQISSGDPELAEIVLRIVQWAGESGASSSISSARFWVHNSQQLHMSDSSFSAGAPSDQRPVLCELVA